MFCLIVRVIRSSESCQNTVGQRNLSAYKGWEEAPEVAAWETGMVTELGARPCIVEVQGQLCRSRRCALWVHQGPRWGLQIVCLSPSFSVKGSEAELQPAFLRASQVLAWEGVCPREGELFLCRNVPSACQAYPEGMLIRSHRRVLC